jgi:hypothetical protein
MLDGLGGAAVSGLQQGEVTADLARAERDLRLKGLGQLAAGPGAVPAEQLGQSGGDALPPDVVRFGAGRLGGECGGAAGKESLEGGPGGVGVAAEVVGDAGADQPRSNRRIISNRLRWIDGRSVRRRAWRSAR